MCKDNEVTLRDWCPADASALVNCLNNIRVMQQLPDSIPSPFTIRHARVFIGMNNCTGNRLVKAIEYQGEVVGSISLIPQEDVWRRNAEIRFFLDESYWGKGIMTRAIGKMVKYAFSDYDFERIFTGIFANNLAAMKVLEHAGFQKEGIMRNAIFKDGKLLDAHLYSILRR